jgi:ribose 5-phosphate isomerase A
MNLGKQTAARYAAGLVRDGMTVGLGSGTTAEIAVEILGRRRHDGLRFTGVPTSERTAELAQSYGIPLRTLDEASRLDITIDGADEVDPGLNLIKGHGGALLREKLVGEATDFYVIVVDASKLVSRLGEHSPVPVEVVSFAWQLTADRLAALGIQPRLRGGNDPYITDGQNYILDCDVVGRGDGYAELATAIKLQTGVVEHGLFLGMADEVAVGDDMGELKVLRRQP